MPERLDDKRVRLAAFRWLEEQVARHGDVLPRSLLIRGFEIEGHRVPLMSRQGIFKPAVLAEVPLTITTTVHGPYDDQMSADGFLLYYGVRYTVSYQAEDELASLEEGTHPKLEAARRAGLQNWWGKTEDENYFLLIGAQLGNLGWEGDEHRCIEENDLAAIMDTTRAKLQQAGFSQVPALHAQFEPDF